MTRLAKFIEFPPGVSAGVRALVSMMRHYDQQVLGVWKFSWNTQDTVRAYTYAVIFEQGVGDYICVISRSGAASGYKGEGPRAYELIEEFLETNKIVVWDGTTESEEGPTTHEVCQLVEENLPQQIMYRWARSD